MTTINNLTIEQMREIVEGAPGLAEVCIPCLEDVMYFAKRDDGKWFKWSNGYNQWLEYFGKVDPMDLALDLNDLRTAIAKHDSREFKVGDLVVLNQCHSQNRVLKIQMFHEDFIRAFVRDSIKYSFGHKINFRHATPEEIKAGHRLEAERHG
ncbi:hypothetical protein [Acinetobacter bereziniae]|uniref:hypothetical protein n=1 Tax=Acinetobacter bereziniae TaxID=106648 RepID=UPI0012504C75|nr:hypothetical protein [Acinetobacter bereziniae]